MGRKFCAIGVCYYNLRKMFIIKLFKSILALFFIFIISKTAYADTPQEIRDAARANNAFGVKLYSKLLKGTTSQNILCAPCGISEAFAMIYSGASSDTAKEIAQTMSYSTDTEKNADSFNSLSKYINSLQEKNEFRFLTSCAVWPEKNLKFLSKYIGIFGGSVNCELKGLDFSSPKDAVQKINEQVSQKTGKKITELFSKEALSPNEKMVLACSAYFVGNWEKPFLKTQSQNSQFWVSTSTLVNVKMMCQENSFPFAEEDGVKVIELPYSGEDVSLIILMPKEIGDFKSIEKKLTPEKLFKYAQGLWDRQIRLYLPRFSVEYDLDMKQILEKMGIKRAFSSGADFSKMSDNKELYISQARQRALIEANEEGSATAKPQEYSGFNGSVGSVELRVDRPFMFFVRDNRFGTILFIGKVQDPS